jgi:hypothetical protein
MMVRDGWHYHDDDPTPSWLLHLAAVFLLAAWVIVLLMLLVVRIA